MPLTLNRLLIGSRGGAKVNQVSLYDAVAGCSWDFFGAGNRTAELEAKRARLRSRVSAVVDGIVTETLDEAAAGGTSWPRLDLCRRH